MKIRIRDNSIRLRLGQGEVAALEELGRVATTTVFSAQQILGCVIESSPACVAPTASFRDGTIKIRVPEASVTAWAKSEQVTMAGEQLLEDGATLALMVEKDFTCLAPRTGEDESDLFPHPAQNTESN